MKWIFTDACFLICIIVELGILTISVMSLHILLSSWKRCSDVCTPCLTKLKEIKPYVKTLRNMVVLSEGFLTIPHFVLRISPSSETWQVLVLQLFEQVSLWTAVLSYMFLWEWPNVLHLKEMQLSVLQRLDRCGTQSTTNPRSFLPLGRVSSLLGRFRRYAVTFISPLLMPVSSKESEWVTVQSYLQRA